MTLFLNWTRTPAALAAGWTLFHFLWEGVAIAAALAVALLFLKASRARYAAACFAMVLMLASTVATFVIVAPGQARNRAAVITRNQRPNTTTSTPPAIRSRFRAPDLLPWASILWLAGVMALSLRTMAGWMTMRRLQRSGVCQAPPVWQRRLDELAAGVRLSRPVRLLESCLVDSPLATGWIRPVVLIPLGLLAGMPADHVEAILLHELAHIRRRDYLVNLLQTLTENLLFYHPAVWWVSRVIRTEREHCCDDLVVAVRGNARGYAAALAALEQNRWAGAPALAATGGDLMKRIRRLLNRPEPPRAAFTPALVAGLVIATAAVSLSAWQPRPQERAQERSFQDSPYRKWLNEDVAYIITDEERSTLKQLATNPERERFIEQFWMRRDPTPGTVENEFKEEHYRRIAFSNERFAALDGLPGWKTDRGRIYITYGPPDEIDSFPSGDQARPYPYERWKYRHIADMGDNVTISFIDANRNGQYRISEDSAIAKAQGPWLSREGIWSDVVRRGDMRRQVRGLGTLGDDGTAEVKIAVSLSREMLLGKIAMLDLGFATVSGRVARLDPPTGKTATVMIQLDAPPPVAAKKGQTLDAAIEIETLNDVIHVARPVFAQPNSTGLLFKIEPDGQHAVRVPVQFGKTSVNLVEILGGLAPGDRVIVSDTSALMQFDRIELRP